MIDAPERTLNIKDFVIEPPANTADHPFDPKKDIPTDAWKAMADLFESEKHSPSCNGIFVASAMKLLSEYNPSGFTPEIDAQGWDAIDSGIRSDKLAKDWDGYLRTIQAVKEYDPEKGRDEKYLIHEEQINDIVREQLDSDTISPRTKLLTLSHLRITNPEYDLQLPAFLWDELNVDYKFQAQNGHPNPFLSSNFLVAAKLVDPKRFKEELVPPPEWKILKDHLKKMYDPSNTAQMLGYTLYVRNLLLLQADEIKMTENGLQLIMPERLDNLDPKKDIPNLRKF